MVALGVILTVFVPFGFIPCLTSENKQLKFGALAALLSEVTVALIVGIAVVVALLVKI